MITAILLAAGESKRMGKPKQLLSLDRSTVLGQALDNLLNSKVDNVIVVVGYRAEEIKKSIGDRPVIATVNQDYRQGMSTSIIAGLKLLADDTDAFMLALADQPFIDSKTIDHLIDEFQKSKKGIAITVCKGRRGHPVIFSTKYRNELMGLKGDVGAKEIIMSHPEEVLEVPVDCEGVIIDIDTAEDYSANSSG